MQDESVKMRNLDDGKCLSSFKSYVQVLMLTGCKNVKFTGRKIKNCRVQQTKTTAGVS